MIKRLLILLCLLPISAAAEPVEIEASGSLVWQQSDQTYRATGDAVAVRGALRITADELVAHYKEANGKTDIEWLEAKGNVQLQNNGTTASGPYGSYRIDTGEIVLRGAGLNITGQNGDSITAEKEIRFNDKSGAAFAAGAPVITRTDRRIAADQITAQFVRDQNQQWTLQNADAAGNVTVTGGINSPEASIATGSNGTYDAAAGTALLVGNVKIKKGLNQLNGERAEIDLNSGQARLLPSPGQGRVKALIHQN